MSSVTFPVAIGGDGSTVTDDDNATTGLRNGGWRTRFIPCFTNLVDICDYTVSYAAQLATFAEPPPMGSTTPNTGAFTRITVTGSTAPANGLYLPAANSLGFATNSTERLRLNASGNLGLGVTPSATYSGYKSLQVTSSSLLHGNGSGAGAFMVNAYYSGASTVTYVNSASASMYQQASGAHSWHTAPSGTAGNAFSFTQAMTLDSSGNLGLGATPSAFFIDVAPWLQVNKITIGNYGGFDIGAYSTNAYYSSSGAWTYIGTAPATQYVQFAGSHRWNTAPSGPAGNAFSFTQAMTLDASGNLLVGATSTLSSAKAYLLAPSGSNGWTAKVLNNANVLFNGYNSSGSQVFYVAGGGTIAATSSTITVISDQRLKENIRDLDDGLSTILALKPRKFDWKDGKGRDIKDDRGFIAQEFEQVFPDMIDTWKDPAPEGEEPYKSVRPDLIPVMVKAIQELSAELNELKQRIH